MSQTYTYSLENDFSGAIKSRRLQDTINANVGITPTVTVINVNDDVVDIIFDSSLSAGEITILESLNSSHNAGENPKLNLNSKGSVDTYATIEVTQTGNRTITLPDATDTLVGENISQNLQNKKLITANTEFADSGDNTKIIKMDTSTATSGTSTTLKGNQTGNRTITLPDADDTLVGASISQNLSNKKFIDSNVSFVNISDNSKQILFSIGDSSTSTNTTIKAIQTGNREITLPDASTTLVGNDNTQSISNKIFILPQINDTSSNNQYIFGVSELTSNRTITLPLLTGNDIFVFKNHTETLTNKTIDADNNTITNIEDTDIKSDAAINSTKIGNGDVTNTELSYINSVSSNVQTQLDTINNSLVTRVCDLYHKPLSITSFTSTWTDVPMNIQRTIDSNFTHTVDTAAITIVNSDMYFIIAKCSGYNTTNSRSASQFRLVKDSGSGYVQIEGTIGYMYHRYSGFLGYETASTPLIISLTAGDKIKMQIKKIQGTATLYIPSEAASIVIKNV